MNYLEKATEQMKLIDGKNNEEDIRRAYLANSYALIAIAEQLEKMNGITCFLEGAPSPDSVDYTKQEGYQPNSGKPLDTIIDIIREPYSGQDLASLPTIKEDK